MFHLRPRDLRPPNLQGDCDGYPPHPPSSSSSYGACSPFLFLILPSLGPDTNKNKQGMQQQTITHTYMHQYAFTRMRHLYLNNDDMVTVTLLLVVSVSFGEFRSDRSQPGHMQRCSSCHNRRQTTEKLNSPQTE